MKVIRVIALLLLVLYINAYSSMFVNIEIKKHFNAYIIKLAGENLFLYETGQQSNSPLHKLADEKFIKQQNSVFTFDASQINSYKSFIDNKGEFTDNTLLRFYNKKKTYFSSFVNRNMNNVEIVTWVRERLKSAIDTLDQNVRNLIINNIDNTSQGIDPKYSFAIEFKIDLSKDTEFTKPFRTLYNLIRIFCSAIDVDTKPIESTAWIWGRRALYTTLLVAGAYGVYQTSKYFPSYTPSAETVGGFVTSGLQKTGQVLEKLGDLGKTAGGYAGRALSKTGEALQSAKNVTSTVGTAIGTGVQSGLEVLRQSPEVLPVETFEKAISGYE